MIKKGSGKGLEDKTFHYTKPEMVKNLLKLLPFQKGDRVLDAGSGKNKVWYNLLPDYVEKYECEIEDGCDFLKWDIEVDWVIGNPPYDIGWKFFERAMEIATKGIAFLLSIKAFNMLTPHRLEKLKSKGFVITQIHIVSDKRWYGRYYFVIFQKGVSNSFASWDLHTY